MKFVYLIAIFVGFALPLHSFAQDEDTLAVKAAFHDYKEAILNDNGEKAFSLVDNRTRKYYSDILQQSIILDSLAVNELSILDKMMVLIIRSKVPKEKLLKMDGKALFIYAVENGMVGKESVANNDIGKVMIHGNFASGVLLVMGNKTALSFEFYKEKDQWQIDLTALFEYSAAAFRSIIEDSGKTENEYLSELISSIAGKKVTGETWKPIKP